MLTSPVQLSDNFKGKLAEAFGQLLNADLIDDDGFGWKNVAITS